MKLIKFALLAILSITAVTYTTNALAKRAEMEAVKVPLENYLKGHSTGNGEYYKKAFHENGALMFVYNGELRSITFKDYISRASGKPPKDEAQRKRRIESIEINGTIAFAKLILDYPTVHFTDYMTLHKIDGEWKITNKAAHSVRKPAK